MNSNGKENGNDGADENSDKGLSDVTSDGATSSGSTATTSSGKEENPEEDYIRNHLKTYTWYHGLMFGNICDKLLKWDHSFLVRRVITKTDKFLCLSVRIASKVYHFRLRTNQHGWTCPKLQEKFPRLPKQRYEHIFEIINSWSQIFPSIIAVPRRSMVLQHDWIQLDQILGKGAFGEVFKARFTASGATASIEVAAKRALGDAKRSKIQEFCHEASIQAVLQHENVVAFYGIASLEEPIIVLMELVTGGDLEKLLKSNLKISKVQIIYFAMNIACGMRYIASKNVIHRDLAARNCLITKDLKAKISDFGLSRLGPQVIEKSIKKAPIRWMSPESLLTGTFNEKTDVWSYGVLLTEMMTRCAHKPLWPMGIKDAQEHIKTSDAPHRIQNGEPWELLAIVDACCDRNPETRFNFQTVKRQMRTIYTNCLAAGNQQQETNQTPIGPTSGVIPLEMKKSNDRQKTMNTTLGRKKSKDGGMIKSSKSKKSKKSKRKFFSFRRKNKNGIQLPTGMSTVPVGSPKATPTSQAPSLPTPPLNTPPLPPPQTSVTSVPSPSQNSAPPISGPPTSTQSKSPTTTQ
ncbi:hypothetical protein L3Y34_016609 [Caenorhabditis briggsae]|uniref:Tyrosine-protein kinase n=2 Tax=Caenorhabditis briggsae TaxID=6238 RepID=A0AAE9DXP2_CAEBR|nr:hypothetical protein L3Y34_016609 [Caenorhabditis briggsae]